MIEYRGYYIKTDPLYPRMTKIEMIGRGSIHLSLRGHYTSQLTAMKAIDSHKGEEE